MKAHNIEVKKTARYFTLGELTPATCTIWFVCHGYGQLANYFLKKFEVLADDQTFIVAPEAFNRFYLEGFTGRVGANWMTKEDRLNDIHDYVGYLNQLYHTVLSEVDVNKLDIRILGFSQGTATVCRWVANGQVKVDKLILWAGVFPPDLNHGLSKQGASKIEVTVVVGKQDEFLKDKDLQMYINEFKQSGFSPNFIQFDGKHEIHQETLVRIK